MEYKLRLNISFSHNLSFPKNLYNLNSRKVLVVILYMKKGKSYQTGLWTLREQ